jgi:transposase
MRIIGLDIHRAFAEAVAWDDGKLKRLGRVDMRRPLLEAFAKKLLKDDVVVVEATGNASSVAAVIAPHVKKVVIANPKQVRIIAQRRSRPIRSTPASSLADEGAKRLMTIPGVDMVVALTILAAIGEVRRFEQPQKLVSYLGLNPSVRQSGPGPAYHGRITKQGRGHARGMLVEAAWAAARASGPLRFLPSGSRPPRSACRRRRDSPEARGDHLAFAEQRRKLCVDPTVVTRQEAARS